MWSFLTSDMNGFIYPLNGFYRFLMWMGICNCVLISVIKGQSSLVVNYIIDTCIKRRFGHSLCFKIIKLFNKLILIFFLIYNNNNNYYSFFLLLDAVTTDTNSRKSVDTLVFIT